MALPELFRVLDMRVAGELARMSDLARIVPFATSGVDPARQAAFKARVAHHESWAKQLVDSQAGLQDWTGSDDRVGQLVDELVASLMTQLLRSQGLDIGTFNAAELLLRELVGRAGVPGLVLRHTQELESIDHTRAAVSLRFPGSRIWELPFLAHEFGHHATAELRHREPALPNLRPLSEIQAEVVKMMRATKPPNAYAEPHAAELLADCVATIAVGPTFPIACLCLRVPDLGKASRWSKTHPSWLDRVGTMREVLDGLAGETGRERYRQQREMVVDPLAAVVLGSVPSGPPAGRQAAQRAVKTVLEHRPDLVYGDADAAINVTQRLEHRDQVVADSTSVSAVVDGAWRWRLLQPHRKADDEVAALAVDYCRQLSVEHPHKGV
jgi:hypothetical protein